jgi:RimJ/RimL family protein N-acetyltransferase
MLSPSTEPAEVALVSTPLSVKPTLCGDLVELRPFTGDDAVAMAEILADPEIARLTGSVTRTEDLGTPPPLETLREWYGSRSDQGDRLDLAIVDRASGRVVGEVVLNEWDADCASANFRILVGPTGRGRGLGTEATRLFLAHAFETVGLHRVSLEVFDFNPGARRVYEKVGFVHEGTRRQAHVFDGERIDAHDMAVLAPEWREHRGRGGANGAVGHS